MCVGAFSSQLFLATVPSIKTRRVLHFAVYLDVDTFKVQYSVELEPVGVTQEGVNTGAFFFFWLYFLPHRHPAVLAFTREQGPSVPIPREQQIKAEFCPLTKLFSSSSLSIARPEIEKKKNTLGNLNSCPGCQMGTRIHIFTNIIGSKIFCVAAHTADVDSFTVACDEETPNCSITPSKPKAHSITRFPDRTSATTT